MFKSVVNPMFRYGDFRIISRICTEWMASRFWALRGVGESFRGVALLS